MTRSKQIAEQFREVYLSGEWIATTNIKAQLVNVPFEQAMTKVGNLNSLAALAFHLDYYVAGVSKVLKGGPLDIRDKYSFDLPPMKSSKDWELLLEQMCTNAENFATLIENLPDEQLDAVFVNEKYGTYQRNFHGLIEHSYYHLGQIVLIKKLLMENIG